MLFGNAMCVFCRSRAVNPRIRSGGVCVCGECFAALPRTGSGMSFAAERHADYILSPFYYKGKLRESVLRYKFHGETAYSRIFALLLDDAISKIPKIRGFDMLLPVPLSEQRMKERGYNQAELIAKPFAKLLGVWYSDGILTRVRNTDKQSGMIGWGRVTNVKDAFSVNGDVRGKTMIVLDDICTTGYTIDECARTLKNAGARRVIGIAFAIAYNNRRLSPESRAFF